MGAMVFLYEEILCDNSRNRGWITEGLVSLQNDEQKMIKIKASKLFKIKKY